MHIIKSLQRKIYKNAVEKGLWNNTSIIDVADHIQDECDELIYEIKSNKIFYIVRGKPCGMAIELADIVILALCLAEKLNIDLYEFIKIKHDYNTVRAWD